MANQMQFQSNLRQQHQQKQKQPPVLPKAGAAAAKAVPVPKSSAGASRDPSMPLGPKVPAVPPGMEVGDRGTVLRLMDPQVVEAFFILQASQAST